ncbi:MAG: hypothetical protein SFZ02_19540 [bacterium]|nr:hypothetical protein [bacterium]
MKTYPTLHSHTMITLPHRGLCGIIGIAPNFHIYAEELYPPHDTVAQHILSPDGVFVQSVDETHDPLLTLPKDLIMPITPPTSHPLNYRGGRFRGMREAERLSEWARPFSIAEKMTFISKLGLAISPIQLFGMIESAVLSSAPLGDGWFVVCRRMVLALALPKVAYDTNLIPYDYDGHTLQTAHLYHESWEDFAPIEAILAGLDGIYLKMAHDCVVMGDKVIISEGGGMGENNTIHQWSIAHPPKSD